MSDLLTRPVVPVADDEDARVTAQALAPHLDGTATVFLVYVVEKAGGAMDKAGVEQRELAAEEAFEAFEAELDTAAIPADVETDIHYDTDVVDGVFDAATEIDATTVAFVPRGGGTLLGLLTGNRTERLVTENPLPVVSLPAPDGDEGGGTGDGEAGADTEET
ncbi:universal stress protein [Haloglomus litoreum]|uniref:universal stress protein n=1 Tax=Haloglomus litoreum TaxID=3034026 RepID=UPI0023E8960C|nr:universal stress protein [Haloglomus sp. DT116]